MSAEQVLTLRPGDTVEVHVPDELPDPTDIAFGCMRGGILRVVKVEDGWFEYEVLRGTVYRPGARGSIPLPKYAPYLQVL